MRLQIGAASFYWLPISGCFSPLSSFSLSFCLISLPLWFPTLWGGAGFPAQSWLVSGRSQRPDSRLKAAGLPPDTMHAKPRTRRPPFLRTQPAAGRRLQGGANPVISIGLPKGQGDSRQPGVGMLEVVLDALETFPLLLLALNSVEADQADKPCPPKQVPSSLLALPQRKLLKQGPYLDRFSFPTRRDSSDPLLSLGLGAYPHFR